MRRSFIDRLGETAISSLTGSTLSDSEREDRFHSLLESHFNMPGISKFVLARYWKMRPTPNAPSSSRCSRPC